MRFVSPRTVAAAYRSKLAEELGAEWAIVLLYRPLSLLLAPAFIALQVAPMAITLAGLALALALPWLATSGLSQPFLWVGGAAVACCIVDCLDGDVARATNRTTARGAYADFIVDIVYRACLYVSIGLLSVVGEGPALGLVAAWLALAARCGRLYLERSAESSPAAGVQRAGAGPRVYAFLSGLDHLTPILVLAFGYLERIDWLLAWLLLYSFCDFAGTQLAVLRRLR